MTEREQFMKWLETCPCDVKEIHEDINKYTINVRVLFNFSSSHEDIDHNFKVGMTDPD